MLDLTIYELAFHSGLHVGTRTPGLEEGGVAIPSDTLFAALIDAWRRAGGDVEALVAPFVAERDPPLLITSAFPRAGDVRFFPVPVPLGALFTREMLSDRRKEIRRIRFVSEALLRLALDGRPLDDWLYPEDDRQRPVRGVALQGGTLWLTVDEASGLPRSLLARGAPAGDALRALRHRAVYARERVPRVTVNRVNLASNIYHAGRTTFAAGCGLWFGIRWRRADALVRDGGPSYREEIERALGMLQEDGLGGERSAGYGAFKVRAIKSLSLPAPKAGAAMYLLSRYRPHASELPDALTENAAYALTSVAGWLRTWDGAAQRRKRLWFVEAGSVVRAVGNGPWGDVSDVRPTYESPSGAVPHPVWRSGLAVGAAWKEARDG